MPHSKRRLNFMNVGPGFSSGPRYIDANGMAMASSKIAARAAGLMTDFDTGMRRWRTAIIAAKEAIRTIEATKPWRWRRYCEASKATDAKRYFFSTAPDSKSGTTNLYHAYIATGAMRIAVRVGCWP